jgi:3-hydroxyisobutyrate dehydrogenase-like beta-hydroxyacid dehydrogenase
MSFETIGFVGLGTMGGAIVQRLLETGHRVVGYNRTPEKAAALNLLGMELAGTPREAAERSDVCFSMVTNSEALAAIARGENGVIAGLKPASVFVEMSTVSPSLTEELAGEVTRAGSSMLDSPVSGSVAHARSGRLSFMVGGDPEVLDRVKPVLLAFGEKATWVGPNGRGTLMKLATNLQVYVQTLAFAESMRLAERGGIDPKVAMEVLLNSVIASPMLGYRAPFMLERPPHAWFNIDLTVKDLTYALEAGRRLGAVLPTTEVTVQAFKQASEMGLGTEEAAAIYDAVDRLTLDS